MEKSALVARRESSSLRSLIAFAAARSYSASTNNPLNSVLPLFEPIAAALHGNAFDTKALSREMSERYDLIVSEELCSFWSEQLVKRGLLVPIANALASGGYEWSQERVANAPDGAFAEELSTLLSDLREFAERSSDLITSSLTDEQLVVLLRRGAIASMFPRLHQNSNPVHNSEDEYVFSRFVEWSRTENPRALDSIATLRRAAVYSDLILHLREPRKPTVNAQVVFAYLDSPLVMDLIGLGGKLRAEFAKRLVETLRELKVVCLVSPVMVDEIKINITALLRREPRDRHGPTADALRKGDFRIEFVEACFDRVEALIEAENIQIDRSFERYLDAKYDESGKNLEQELLSKLQSHYRMVGAAERDAKSLFGCYGRRDGNKANDMYSSRCFFVTSNDMLAAVGNRFFKESLGYRESHFPIVVSRSIMSAIADAIKGVSTTGGMTEQELIISAADATAYDPLVFDNIEQLLKRMTPDQASDLSDVLQRTDVSRLAMDLVRGDPSKVTSQRVALIVDSVKSRLDEEAESRVADARAKERAQASHAASLLEAKISSREARLKSVVEASRKRHDAACEQLIQSNYRSAKFVSGTNRWQVLGAIAVALVVGVSVYLLSAASESISTWAKFLLASIAALASAVPLIGLPSIRRIISSRITKQRLRQMSDQAAALGYTFPFESLPSDALLRAELDRQFDSSVEPDKRAERTSLFD